MVVLASAGLIGLVSAAFFTCGLRDTSFVDEYAYITQSYQPDLVFSGHMNDLSWLEPLAYDLVPLPKLWTNLAFRAAGIPRPSPWNAVPWYRTPPTAWGTERELIIARLALRSSWRGRLHGDLRDRHDVREHEPA